MWTVSANRSYSGAKYCFGETVGNPFASLDNTSLLSVATCICDVIAWRFHFIFNIWKNYNYKDTLLLSSKGRDVIMNSQ